MDTTTPAAQAIFIRAHLRLLSVGLKNSRLSGTEILSRASKITGKSYKRGAYAPAILDLTAIIEAAK